MTYIHYFRLAGAIFACSINASFTRGYNSVCMYNMRYVVGEWAGQPYIKPDEEDINLSDNVFTYSFSHLVEMSYSIGAIIGSIMVLRCSRKFGRRGGLLISNIMSTFGILLSGYCKFFNIHFFLILGRILQGIDCGLSSSLAPMYLYEISPMYWRAKVGAFYSFCTLVGEVIGFSVSKRLATTNSWPIIFSLNILPAMLQLTILSLYPESPKYTFVFKKKEIVSRKAVIWLRGYNLSTEEYNEYVYELLQQNQPGGVTMKVFGDHFILMRALLISSVLLASTTLCGVRIIIGFATFSSTALTDKSGEMDMTKHIGLQLTLIGITLVNIYFVDLFPRNILLFITFLIMSICCAVSCFLINFFIDINSPVVIIIAFIYLISFKIGCGCLACFITSEYFNTLTSPWAFTIGTSILWTLNIGEYLFTTTLEIFLRGYLFLTYAIINGGLAYFCYNCVIDTRQIPVGVVYQKLYAQMMNKKLLFS